MADTSSYPTTSTGDLKNLLDGFVPQNVRSGIVQALKASGIISGGGSQVGTTYLSDPNLKPFVNAATSQVAILSPDAVVNPRSNGAVVIATTGGDNYVDISNANAKQDKADTVFGGSGSDFLYGNSAASKLVGGSGAETLVSGGGADTLVGGSGTNAILAGGQSDVFGGTGASKITAGGYGGASDTVHAGSGSDTITLGSGNNLVYGPSAGGSATIRAGSGNDTIYSGAGASTITGGANTELHLGKGAVTLQLSQGSNDTIFGGNQSGPLTINKSASQVSNVAGNADGSTTYVFKGGSTVTTHNVDVVFTNHVKSQTS